MAWNTVLSITRWKKSIGSLTDVVTFIVKSKSSWDIPEHENSIRLFSNTIRFRNGWRSRNIITHNVPPCNVDKSMSADTNIVGGHPLCSFVRRSAMLTLSLKKLAAANKCNRAHLVIIITVIQNLLVEAVSGVTVTRMQIVLRAGRWGEQYWGNCDAMGQRRQDMIADTGLVSFKSSSC